MTTFTKLAAYDKAIAEMQTTSRIHSKRLGEGSPSLRSSNNGLFDLSDSDSEAGSPGSNNGFGSMGRHSFISISEENNSPSIGASYAFMASSRGSRLLQEEELARLSDVPLGSSNEIMMDTHFAGLDKGIRSPALGKDKRAEYFAQIKSQMLQGANAFPSTSPPVSSISSSPDLEEAPKRSRRFSLMAKDKFDLEKEKSDHEAEEKTKKDKDKENGATDKKKEKEKLKEEKQKKKLEKKELKLKKAAERESGTPSPENPRIMQQFFGIQLNLFHYSVTLILCRGNETQGVIITPRCCRDRRTTEETHRVSI